MTARQWWPAEWADEVMPPGLASPDAFIVPTALQDRAGWVLRYADDEDEDLAALRVAVVPGDIVPFLCCDDLGEVEVTINADGTFEAHGEVPADATHFCIGGDPDTLAYSLKEFAEQYAADDRSIGLEKLGSRVVVRVAWWSDALPHKLIVEDGKARFVAVSGAEARQ